MALVEELAKAIASAMKGHEVVRLATLRLLKTALVNKAVEKGRDLDDAESRQVVVTLVKQRRESIEQFSKAGRHDLADNEARELEILTSYLPPPVAPEELESVIGDAIAETRASSARDLGRVMKVVMTRLAGRPVDGKAASEAVRRKLVG